MTIGPATTGRVSTGSDRSSETGRFGLACLILWALPVLVIITGLVLRATFHVSKLFNEGWNAFHAAGFHAGEPLYHPAGALLTNNYPPLSFVLTSYLLYLIPDAVFCGRILAGLALIGITAAIAGIIGRLARDRGSAIAAALVFLTWSVANFLPYLIANDPSFLALACMTAGLAFYLRQEPRGGAAVGAAALIVVGLFIKHNSIALPLSLTLWLFWRDRAQCLRFVLAGLILTVLGLAVCRAAFGDAFITSLLSPRRYSVGMGIRNWLDLIDPAKPFVVFAVLAWSAFRRDAYIVLFSLFVMVAALVAAIVLMGEGTIVSATFELPIASALLSGRVLQLLAMGDTARRTVPRPVCLIVLAGCTFISPTLKDVLPVLNLPAWLAFQHQQEAETLAVVHWISARPGPALCATQIYCYWAGKSAEVDSFNVGQAIETGALDPRVLTDRLTARYYATIELEPGYSTSRFVPRVLDPIQANYTEHPMPKEGVVVYEKKR